MLWIINTGYSRCLTCGPVTEYNTRGSRGQRPIGRNLHFFDKWPVGRFFALLPAVAHRGRGSGHQTSNEKVVKQTTKNIITYILIE